MFLIYGGKTEFMQWEQGQRVINPRMKVGDEVVFTNASGATIIMEAYKYEGEVVADVPNELLQTAVPIVADVQCDCGKYTRFNVVEREKPEDYQFIDNVERADEKENISGNGSGADILNEDGVIKQEHLPEGYPYKTVEEGYILEECQPILNEEMGGYVLANDLSDIVAGETYTINWNGTDYVCEATLVNSGNTQQLILGNFGIVSGGESTGEPFFIVISDKDFLENTGLTAIIVPLDGASDITISIKGIITKYIKMNNEYIDLEWVPETIYVDDENGEDGSYISNGGGNTFPPSIEPTLVHSFGKMIVRYTKNGVKHEYKVDRKEVKFGGSVTMIYFGNAALYDITLPNTGEPFVIYCDFKNSSKFYIFWEDGITIEESDTWEIVGFFSLNRIPSSMTHFSPIIVIGDIERNETVRRFATLWYDATHTRLVLTDYNGKQYAIQMTEIT